MKILIDGQTLSTPELHRGIGEVFLKILNKLIPVGEDHQFFLCVYDDYDRSALQGIDEKVKLLTLGKEIDTSESGSKIYTESVLQCISENEIDCFWIPNPVMPNVNFLKKSPMCRVIITFYDLIPFIFKRIYLNSWPESIRREYLGRLKSLDSIADFIMPISDSTKNDLSRYLKINPTKMRTVYLGSKNGSDGCEKSQNFDSSLGKYILYVGGFDPRKNMEKSVLAFKCLVEKYHHSDLNYFIICNCDESTKEKFYKFVQKTGLSGKIRLTGYVSDSELDHYYKNAELLFFPSLYEGFGLPVVDAMAASLPVVVSNCSSLREIAGDAGLIFDPDNIEDMAEKLHRILSDQDLRTLLSTRSLHRSQRFSWKITADEYLQVLESRPPSSIMQNMIGTAVQKSPLKIAYFSPVHPQISGISQYSKELLLELQNYADVDLFLDKGVVPEEPEIKQKFRYFCYTDFEKLMKVKNYDGILYHIGNNPLHEYIYQISLRYPGTIVLHDYVIYPFLRHVTLDRGKFLSYLTEIYNTEPPQKRANLVRQIFKKGLNSVDALEYPLNDRVIKAGKTVIVHSQHVRKLLKGYPQVYVIPHGRHSVDFTEADILENKKMLHLKSKDLIISIFGFLNLNKRIDVTIRVFRRLQKTFPNIRLLLVGELNADLREIVKPNMDSIDIIGYTSEDLYYRYMSVSDIVINLRSPTMGETSGTLLDAMGFGKAVIVSNIGSYREIPDSCCWKVDVDGNEEELLYQYLRELIMNPKIREVMGKNGKDFIKKNNDWKKIVLKYLDVLDFK